MQSKHHQTVRYSHANAKFAFKCIQIACGQKWQKSWQYSLNKLRNIRVYKQKCCKATGGTKKVLLVVESEPLTRVWANTRMRRIGVAEIQLQMDDWWPLMVVVEAEVRKALGGVPQSIWQSLHIVTNSVAWMMSVFGCYQLQAGSYNFCKTVFPKIELYISSSSISFSHLYLSENQHIT